MNSNTRSSFSLILSYLEKVNPFVIVLSIVGLCLEYTSVRTNFPVLLKINSAFDLFFLFDFIIRMIALPTKKYFFKRYGWVDFLAALPAFETLLGQVVPGFAQVFKIMRIGRFFKILRVLRFIKLFAFLKKMRNDSVYVQSRIMKVGVLVTLVMVIGIAIVEKTFTVNYAKGVGVVIDSLTKEHSSSFSSISAIRHYEILRNDAVISMALLSDNTYLHIPRNEIINQKDYKNLFNQYDDLIEVKLHSGDVVLIHDDLYVIDRDNLLLTLILLVIFLVTLIIFFLGFVFASDIKNISLVIDSIDADDYMLLLEEGEKLKDSETGFEKKEDEDELVTLFKLVNKLIIDKKISEPLSNELGFGGFDNISLSQYSGDPVSAMEKLSDEIPDTIDNDSYAESPQMGAKWNDPLEDDSELPTLDDEVYIDDELAGAEEMAIEEFPEDSDRGEQNDGHSATGSIAPEMLREMFRENREELKEMLREIAEESALHAVKISAKSIVGYLKKNG